MVAGTMFLGDSRKWSGKLKRKTLLLLFLFAGLLLSCDDRNIKGWYGPANTSSGKSDGEITLFSFEQSASIGGIGGGNEDDIPIIHTGADVEADGPWVPTDGVFVRFYTLTVTEAASTGTSSSYYGAFANSTKRTTVTLAGTKIVAIGSYAFYGCTGLESLLSQDNLTPIENTLAAIGSYAFRKSGVTSAELSECIILKTISEYAFDYGASLAGISLPASFTRVADHAFEHGNVLANIYSLIDVPSVIIFPGQYTFSGIAANFTLPVPDGKAGTYALFWSSTNKPNWQQPGSITT
jgi:hypothetical protein